MVAGKVATSVIISTMTREESWQVEGLTLTLLRHISALGLRR